MKYKVGDKVRVKSVDILKSQGVINSKHLSYAWKIIEITEVITSFNHDYRAENINWNEENFEPAFEEWEEVYVWTSSQKEILENQATRTFLYTDKNWLNICVKYAKEYAYKKWENYETTTRKYIAKIPNKHIIEIDWKKIEISEESFEAFKNSLCSPKL